MKHRYKVDHCGDCWFTYAVFRRAKLFWLIPYWESVFRDDDLGKCEEYVAASLKLPTYHGPIQ